MPHLLLTSSPLGIDAKRDLARTLTTALLDALPDHAAERVTIEFSQIDSENLARAGTLIFDGAPADVYLRVSTPRIDNKTRARLTTALAPPIVAALGLAPGEPPDLIVDFQSYEPRDVSVVDRSVKPRRGSALLPALIGIGLVAGVYFAIDRLAQNDAADDDAPAGAEYAVAPRSAPTIVNPGTTTDATKSMAAMHASPAGEGVEAGQQDVRSSSSVAHDDA